MKWNIPERWFEVVNQAVISILLVGLITGFAGLAVLGFFIYVLSFYDDLDEYESAE